MHCDATSMNIYLNVIQSEISQERSKIMNFCNRSYHDLILRYLYSETIKRRSEILLHRHFKYSRVQIQNGEIYPHFKVLVH